MLDLAHVLSAQMPNPDMNPPYFLISHLRHGDVASARPAGASFGNELLITPTHVATHVDSLGHFSANGCLGDGTPVSEAQSARGVTHLDAAALPVFFHRAVLLDVASRHGPGHLPSGYAIGGAELSEAAAGVDLGPGDVALIRTGWALRWDDPDAFTGRSEAYPGISVDGGRWLASKKVAAVGCDTPALEVTPRGDESVHRLLLVEGGIYIFENLALEELSRSGPLEFLFVALPLKIAGATGSPVRPVAIW